MNSTLMGSRVIVPPSLQELKEFLGPSLLKQAHQRTLNSFHLCAGDFGNPAISVDETTSDLLELEVTSHIGVDQDLGEFSRCDDKFGNKVDCVVTVATELCRRFLVWAELAIELSQRLAVREVSMVDRGKHYLGKIQTGTVTSVVIVSIHMKDLLALNGKQT